MKTKETSTHGTRALLDRCSADVFTLSPRLSHLHNITTHVSGYGGMAPSQYRAVHTAIAPLMPCGMVVFSVGADSLMWARANEHTVFLEDNVGWASRVHARNPALSIVAVNYSNPPRRCSRQHPAIRSSLFSEPHILAASALSVMHRIKPLLPSDIKVPWRVFHIDGPTEIPHGRIEPALLSLAMACDTVCKHGGIAKILIHDAERGCEFRIIRDMLLMGKDFRSETLTCQVWPEAEKISRRRGGYALAMVSVGEGHTACRAISALRYPTAVWRDAGNPIDVTREIANAWWKWGKEGKFG
mmetsp:Transcript_61159/g.101757  ORF Transcript_61159/g.101757 Transcript_61159/m.101757 type:complete len:300 (-) Transcript_61159:122-1021(-)|eukprot:CAMPEP_0119304882 /NCGR_PEP_ID=MMETSP1333-20130426/6002_1 /TAXON_ID=418940 /ORGANISM="Scyphosphaera apsteinii, Strain RCC1455" /LENGTH=299 /DNA_ID=CAMNT_0007307843 /DNA_START=203 /DNA_END=1102 /DNA_ORIENTATION=+